MRTRDAGHRAARASSPGPHRGRFRLVVLVAAVMLASVVAWSLGLDGSQREVAATSRSPVPSYAARTVPAESRWVTILDRLDVRRDRVWRTGRTDLLAQVFTRGSQALATDRRALRGYLDRGYSVDGAPMRWWDVQVLDRSARRVRLEVSDRLGAVAVTDPAGARTLLPRDRPSRHVITLVQRDQGWRIATVRAV